MLDYRYRAFLCYSHRDSGWADWLHDAIESYPIPPRLIGIITGAGAIPSRLAPVFRDRDELPSAANLSEKVSDALAQSANLIVICSPHAAQSRWVDEEIRAFQRLGRADRIFCLIVDGEPGASAWAGHEHDECMPPALTRRLDADGRETIEQNEPIAADTRPGGDGKSNARLKLIAGLLGVGLDDLMHRERRRRRARWTVAVGAAVGLLALTTILAVNAIIARHAAERRQKQAEDLVGYMLGDLDDKLREVNRLDILESVGDRVAKYFGELPAADMTDDTLAQRAKALLKIGSVHRDLGRIPAAIEAFNQALASSERLVRDAPSDEGYQSLQAESLTWLGFVEWSQGNNDSAYARFAQARQILERLGSSGKRNDAVQDRLATVRTNIGRILETRQDLDAARAEYLEVMDLYTQLARQDPEKLEWRAEIGYAHRNLGRIALAEGAIADSARELVADRRIKANLAALDPSNNERREDLAISDGTLGWLLYLCGQVDIADGYLQQALHGVELLLAVDSTATDWLVEAGRYGWMHAAAARSRGDFAEAARSSDEALERLDRLRAKNPADIEWQKEWLQAQVEKTLSLLAQRKFEAAKRASDASSDVVERFGQAGTSEGAVLAARALLARGMISASAGDPEAARIAWTQALDAAQARASTSRDPAMLDVVASAHLWLGDVPAAHDTAVALAQLGYARPDFIACASHAGISYEANPDVTTAVIAATRELKAAAPDSM